jgi:hypothetical protein
VAALGGSDGTATGSCSITARAAGSYLLTAAYPGDDNFDPSSTLASTPLTVVQPSSTTVLELSAAKVTYDHEDTERLSVTVSPEFGGLSPTGTVRVKRATATLCAMNLSSGKGSCTLSARSLKAGTHRLVATYDGSMTSRSSASPKMTLEVAKDTTRTTLELSAAKVTYGHEGTERLSVTVSPDFGGLSPTGAVSISGTACLIELSRGKGSCMAKADTFHVGSHSVVAHYWGDGNFSGSLSTKSILSTVGLDPL